MKIKLIRSKIKGITANLIAWRQQQKARNWEKWGFDVVENGFCTLLFSGIIIAVIIMLKNIL